MKKSAETLESLAVGPLPLINRIMDRLNLESLFEAVLPQRDPRQKLSSARALGVFVRNILLSPQPLYALPQWAQTFVPEHLGLSPDQIPLLNDDRIGRALDRLFEVDRANFLTSFVRGMIREFDLALELIHNDSTTVTFTGAYKRRKGRRGKDPLWITRGHNKDHRPDLRQLLFEMTVTEDGAVPIFLGLHNGNVTDDQTHLSTWKVVSLIVGGPNFIYVADSKLCVTDTLTYITGHGGHFVTVLPATRMEEKWFKEWVQTNTVPWGEVWCRPPLRRRHDPPDLFRGFESPLSSKEGYRILWYHSSIKHELDQEARQARIRRAVAELEFLKTRTGARKLKTAPQVKEAAAKILKEAGADRWLAFEVQPGERDEYRQARPGRPGKNTPYRKEKKPYPKLTWQERQDTIAWDAKIDGLFPLITDMKDATLKQVLLWYKFQPKLEKRFEQLKTVIEVRPVCLKSVERVEAYLLLYYLALVIQSLIERELRKAMKAKRIKELPLYWEKRLCKAPTSELVMELFATFRRHRLLKKGREVNRFIDELSPVQRKVLRLLNVSPSDFAE